MPVLGGSISQGMQRGSSMRRPSLAVQLLAHRAVDGSLLQRLLREDGALGADVVVFGCHTRPRARVDGKPLGGDIGARLQRLFCVSEDDVDAIRRGSMDALGGRTVASDSELDQSMVGCSILVRASLCHAPASAATRSTSSDDSDEPTSHSLRKPGNHNQASVDAISVQAAIQRIRERHNTTLSTMVRQGGRFGERQMSTQTAIAHLQGSGGFQLFQVGQLAPTSAARASSIDDLLSS